MTSGHLPTRALGTTGMDITRVGFGSWAVAGSGWAFGWGATDDAESIAAIRHAIDPGRQLDRHRRRLRPRPLGGAGRQGRRGRAARGRPAVRLHQGRPGLGPGRPGGGAPPDHEAGQRTPRGRGLAATAERRPHRPVPGALARGRRHAVGGVLAGHVRPEAEGKVRAIGLSNHSVDQLEAAEQIAHVDAVQPPFSAINRSPRPRSPGRPRTAPA